MEFRQVVEGRQSIRQFLPDPVPGDDIVDMLRLATHAANASNKQMWRFYVVSNREKIAAMRDAVDEEAKRLKALAGKPADTEPFSILFAGAPVVIAVACAAYKSRMHETMEQAGLAPQEAASRIQRPDIQSIGAAIQLLLCSAYEKGYGACWMSAPMVARSQIEEILAAPAGQELCALIPLGRPAVSPPKTSRKPLEQVTTFIE